MQKQVQFFSGLTYSPNDVKSAGTFVIRSSNIKDNTLVSADNVYVNPNIVNSEPVKKDDVIMVVRNGSKSLIGKHALVTRKINNTVIGAFMTGIRSSTPYFLDALLDTINFKKEIYKNLGATINQITVGNLRKMTFKVPNESEKFKIGNLFEKLNYLLTLYEKKHEFINSYITYFIELFYDNTYFFKQKNAHNFRGQKFKLGDILIKNNTRNKDLSILNVESISNKKGFISQKEQFDNYQVASKDLSNYYVIHPKDFAYNPSRINVGSIAYKNPNAKESIVSPLYISFKCNNNIILDKYLWFWFKSSNFKRQRVKLSEGGVRNTLSFNQLSEMRISIPIFNDQEQIINFLEVLINYKKEIDLKFNNLKLIKKSLLQNMFL